MENTLITPITAMDAALQNVRGIRLEFADAASAKAFRTLCYSARRGIVAQSLKQFEPGMPDYNSSPYDNLTFSIRGTCLYIGTDMQFCEPLKMEAL